MKNIYQKLSFNKKLLNILILTVTLMACEDQSVDPDSPEAAKSWSEAEYQVARASNYLAFEVLKSSSFNNQNFAISPLGITHVLGMAFQNHESVDLSLVKDSVFFGGLNKNQIAKALFRINNNTNPDGKEQVSLKNSFWYKEGLAPDHVQQSIIKAYFQADFNRLAVKRSKIEDNINEWISEKSAESINGQGIGFNEDNKEFLINLAYYSNQGSDQKAIFTHNFNINSSRDTVIPYLNFDAQSVRTWTNDHWKMVDFPVKHNGNYHLTLITAADFHSLSDFFLVHPEKDLQACWDNEPATQNTNIQLPRFDITSRYEVDELIENTRLLTLFAEKYEAKDFLVTSQSVGVDEIPYSLKTSKWLQKSHFSSEWLHHNADVLSKKGEKSYTYDRPFIYILRDSSNDAILMMGHYGRPK